MAATALVHAATQGPPDAHGNTTTTYTAGTPVVVLDAAPATGTEYADAARDVARHQWTLYLAPGTVLGEYDQVTWRGRRYDVYGPPEDWAPAGVVAQIQAVTG